MVNRKHRENGSGQEPAAGPRDRLDVAMEEAVESATDGGPEAGPEALAEPDLELELEEARREGPQTVPRLDGATTEQQAALAL